MGKKMKNVIVFTTNKVPYAVELGWIREVFTLGHVTPVPNSPRAIAGVVNFRGSIVPIIDVRGTVPGHDILVAHQGESALLLEVDRCQAALRAGTINEVSSLLPAGENGYLLDSRGREVELLRPPQLFDEVKSPRRLSERSS